jgi:WD40 repeat protein
LAFDLSPDGRRLTTVEQAFAPDRVWRVCVWDTDPLKEIASQDFPTSGERGWAGLAGKMALVTRNGIAIVDATSGKLSLKIPATETGPLAASGDHRLLAAFQRDKTTSTNSTVRVWEVASGREVATLATGNVDFLALTRDGRALITLAGAALRVWDLPSARVRHHMPLPQEFALSRFVSGFYLAPDDRRATTALADGTLLVWLLPSTLPDSPGQPLSDRDLLRLWDDLTGEDVPKVYAAGWTLADRPREAVPFLAERIRPVVPADAELVRKLIADLNSDQFTRRQSAFRQLEKLGRLAAPALRKLLRGDVPLEQRRRAEALLDKLHGPISEPETLKSLRVVAVVEHIGTPEARQVLLRFTRGAPEAHLTLEAAAALNRLELRPQAKR